MSHLSAEPDATTADSPPHSDADEARVAACLRGVRRLGVAFSGGVDSAVLLAVAVRALGCDRVVGLLAVSPSLAAVERETARRVATEIGAALVEFETAETEIAAYQANGADRCYHCKNEMFTVIDSELVDRLDLDAVAYGENSTDAARVDRPGARAATEHRVLRPLAQAGLTKADVRALARRLGVSVADKPAAPCLASRVPHGEPVTPEKLRQIEDAEDVLRSLGFTDSRVRHHSDVARIEVPDSDLARFADSELRGRVVAGVRAAGFRFVALDLAGIQSGAFTLFVVGHNA